jgi:hypothetical protein
MGGSVCDAIPKLKSSAPFEEETRGVLGNGQSV